MQKYPAGGYENLIEQKVPEAKPAHAHTCTPVFRFPASGHAQQLFLQKHKTIVFTDIADNFNFAAFNAHDS